MEESVLFLEEKELYRNSRNVFTENVRYFVLEDEKTLNEMDELWILKDDRCYIVKWEYRIERIGPRTATVLTIISRITSSYMWLWIRHFPCLWIFNCQ